MKINVSEKDNELILKIEADHLDIGNSVEFRSELTGKSETNLPVITIDFSQVNYIDSSGLGVLITFLKYKTDNNQTLKAINCNDKIKKALENIGYNK